MNIAIADDGRKIEGVAESAKNGKYKGRQRIKIGKLEAMEIFSDYEEKKINSIDAAVKLGVSKSTFLRRYREYHDVNQ